MRNPAQLPSVLLDLSRHPGARHLLNNPQALETFLRSQGWPDPFPEAEQMALPESAEAQEEAEIAPLVETWLASLEPRPLQHLEQALESVCPGSGEMLSMLTPLEQKT